MQGHSTTPDAAAIHAATAQLTALAPAFGERFAAAQHLLLAGGWHLNGQAIHFPRTIIFDGEHCSCQEGSGPVVCLHEIAARILAVAAESRTPPAERCADCGSALTPTTVATIGHRALTICRPCLSRRKSAGRQRQIAVDMRMVERMLGGR